MSYRDYLEETRRARVAADHLLRERVGGRYPWEPDYGFIMTDQVGLAAALEAVRRRICAYGGREHCDCKYGAGRALVTDHGTGEATGCPELRSVIWDLLHPGEAPAALLDDPRDLS